MKTVLVLLITFSTHIAMANQFRRIDLYRGNPPQQLFMSQEVLNNQNMPFLEHIGAADNPYGTTLAMNIQYAPVKALKAQIEEHLGLNSPLKFFKGFIAEGEAHITTVTPVEYHNVLRSFVTPERMNEIARQFEIQSSALEVLALGRGQAALNGKNEETYFIIVRSENLLRIRHAIYQEYVRAGGNPGAWNPEHFFPHITIGYTIRDLHENDGVLKDIEHSLDTRFDLSLSAQL